MSYKTIFPVETYIPNRRVKLRTQAAAEGKWTSLVLNYFSLSLDGVALIILSLVVANIRNCTLPSSKVKALDLLLALTP